jgi:hypothetical protein
VTAGGGTTTLTVERHQLGTAAAPHASGATVFTRAKTEVSTQLNVSSAQFSIAVPVANGYQQTDCVITNQFVKGASSLTTAQRAKVNDTATITRGVALVTGDTSGDVTITLYSGDNCGVSSGTLLKTVTFQGGLNVNLGASFNVTTGDSDFIVNNAELNKATATGDTKFSWRASYTGDAKNNATTDTGCHEAITVNINNNK